MTMSRYYESITNPPVRQDDKIATDIFERVVNDLGRTEPVAAMKELRPYQQQLWDRLHDLRSATPQTLNAFRGTYIGLVSNPTFNAFADTSSTYDLLGFNTGTLQTLILFYNIAIAHQDAFTDWGESSKEIALFKDLSSVNWSGSIHSTIAELESFSVQLCAPRSKARIELANLLPRIALDYILYHEAAHVAFGHVDYLKRFTSTQRMMEFASSALTPSMVSQTLEMQADIFAMWCLTNPYCVCKPGATGNPLVINEDVLTKIIIAVATVFFIMDHHKVSVVKYDNCAHPHPAVRLTACLIFLLNNSAQNLGNPAAQHITKIWHRAMKLVIELGKLGLSSSVWLSGSDQEPLYERVVSLYRELVRISPELTSREVGMKFNIK